MFSVFRVSRAFVVAMDAGTVGGIGCKDWRGFTWGDLVGIGSALGAAGLLGAVEIEGDEGRC